MSNPTSEQPEGISGLMRTRRRSRKVGYVGVGINLLVIVGSLVRAHMVPGTANFTQFCITFGVLGAVLSGLGAFMLAGTAEDEARAEKRAGESPRLFVLVGAILGIVMSVVLTCVTVFS